MPTINTITANIITTIVTLGPSSLWMPANLLLPEINVNGLMRLNVRIISTSMWWPKPLPLLSRIIRASDA